MNTRLTDELDKFLLWWWTGLANIAPQSWREKQKRVKQYLIVRATTEELAFDYYANGHETRTERYSLVDEDPLARRRIKDWLAKIPRIKSTLIVIRLAAAQVLTKQLRYPKSVEQNLHSVLGFDLERQTPFAREDVLFGYKVNGDIGSNIDVELLLIPKRDIATTESELATFDLRASIVDIENRTYFDHQVNLLPDLDGAHATRPAYRTRFALMLLWLALLTAIPVKQLNDTRVELENLRTVEAASRESIRPFNELRDEHERLTTKINYLGEIEAAYIPTIELLDEVTRLLSDGTWVRRFDLKAEKLTIQGESDKASDIPGLIEGSEFFAAPRFSSPVTRNNATGKDRFQLIAEIDRRRSP